MARSAKTLGNLSASASYDSFGNVTNANFPTRYQFTGRELDNFSGLHYYQARFYDGNLGRFISEDPIGFAGGDVNLYGYVWNNPQQFTDPMGLDGWGNDTADWLDERIEYARQYWQYNDQEAFANGVNQTIADVSFGVSDLFRVGSGVGQAIYCEDNIYGKAAFITMDVGRATGIFSMIVGPFAGRVGGTRPTNGKFPNNPNDLLPEIPRDVKGRIPTSDYLRIRPEQHSLLPGETYSPRHHGQHYHVEQRLNPNKSWNNKKNVRKIKPKKYKPGDGTGFLPGEDFP